MFKNIFAEILIFFYNITKDYGLAIILLTLLVRLVTLPLSLKQIRSTQAMQRIAPEQKALQEKYKDNPEKLNKELAELYRANNISLFGGCLPLLVQMPVLFAVIALLRDPAIMSTRIADFSPLFLGTIDLQKTFVELLKEGTGIAAYVVPAILPLLAAATTYFQTRQASGHNAQPGMASMTWLMPILILVFSYNLPQGFPLYWAAGNIFQIGQHLIFNRPSVLEARGGEK
ncbi:MAG: YidC/Oxa1 family membrane protein insertase [Bacillota bacterium]|nr:YidC/Oxa1 family membrane protein insertase [Bacillota bacterium]HPZ22757.1 YidC/Oxa1 family membrane protein insertase [Bacillota bacterium]